MKDAGASHRRLFRGRARAQGKDGVLGREEERIAIPARHVLDLGVRLPLVLLERQGKSGVIGVNSALRCGCRRSRLGGHSRATVATDGRQDKRSKGNEGQYWDDAERDRNSIGPCAISEWFQQDDPPVMAP